MSGGLYRTVRIVFWSQPKIRTLHMGSKLTLLQMKTSSFTCQVPGLVKATLAILADEQGVSVQEMETYLKTLSDAGLVVVKTEGRFMYLPNEVAECPYLNGKHVAHRLLWTTRFFKISLT